MAPETENPDNLTNVHGLTTVDLGDDYTGPVPAAYGYGTERLVDEIVCFEFHGEAPDGFRASRPHHIDGNNYNSRADNLVWVVDEVHAELRDYKETKRLMRPDFLPNRVVRDIGTGRCSDPLFVSANNTPGWVPVPPKTKKRGVNAHSQRGRV
jgi:hypothetical protein